MSNDKMIISYLMLNQKLNKTRFNKCFGFIINGYSEGLMNVLLRRLFLLLDKYGNYLTENDLESILKAVRLCELYISVKGCIGLLEFCDKRFSNYSINLFKRIVYCINPNMGEDKEFSDLISNSFLPDEFKEWYDEYSENMGWYRR